MIIGRTGYLVLSILFLYFFIITFGRRGILFYVVVATATFLTAYLASDTFYQRVNITIQEAADWKPEKPSDTSVGLRLEFYNTSLRIVREHPLIGSGTGSVPAVYARAVSGQNMKATPNP